MRRVSAHAHSFEAPVHRACRSARPCCSASLACERPRDVAVRVSIPGPDSVETPVTGVGVVALPYDRDSVLRQLEARAQTPRPDTAPLESLFAAFRGPFTAYSAVTLRLGKLRDSVAETKDGVPTRSASPTRSVPPRRGPSAPGRSSTARGAISSAAATACGGACASGKIVPTRGGTASSRGWPAGAGARRSPTRPGSQGWAHLRLAPGRWWVYARSWDAEDPNAEWYWNTPVTKDTLFLSSRTARRQLRY